MTHGFLVGSALDKHWHLFLLALSIPLIPSQSETLAAFVVGALLANSAHLPPIAAFMPLRIRQRSRLRRLERWLQSEKVEPMAVALAYGWAVRIGHWLDQSGQRLLVDRGRTPKQSAYRLGRDFLFHLWSLGSDEIEKLHFANMPP